MVAKRVSYEGRVQGVGFRFSVKSIATGYDVVGWVKKGKSTNFSRPFSAAIFGATFIGSLSTKFRGGTVSKALRSGIEPKDHFARSYSLQNEGPNTKP
jgi:Acylphosphatase